ncbi:MAG TPA: hypothetical protein VM925_16825 [Labilithrix sp.]|nr:hypothetical protein [Labilithrix sp.]
MMQKAVFVALCVLAGCQLADDPEPPKCEPGSHAELDHCVLDETTTLRVKISAAAGGTLCTGEQAAQRPPVLTPEILVVKGAEEFQFENADVVPHEIRGADGALWFTVPAGELSPFTSIVKAGVWGYRVSGCAKGGTVTVE